MASRTGKDDAEPRRARLEEQASMLPLGFIWIGLKLERPRQPSHCARLMSPNLLFRAWFRLD